MDDLCGLSPCAERSRTGAGSPPGGVVGGLDQRRENREKPGRVESAPWVPLVQDVPEGGYVGIPLRAGGGFDPLGTRGSDVKAADDLVAVVDHLGGRWVMVTLTVDRSRWLSPDLAYQPCQERVREVMRALRDVVPAAAVYLVTLELQGKTGDGWPHWHCMAWLDDSSVPVSRVKEAVRRAWCVHHVDHETGEFSRHSIGYSDVADCREPRGAGRYLAKYLVKEWPAVPRWMGESRWQLRKFRKSMRFCAVLAALGRHVPRVGGRRPPGLRRRAPARPLFDRMSASGSALLVFRRVGEKLHYSAKIPVPMSDAGVEVLQRHGAEFMRGGPGERPARWRFSVPAQAVASLAFGRSGEQLGVLRREYRASLRASVASRWERMQGGALEVQGVALPRAVSSMGGRV